MVTKEEMSDEELGEICAWANATTIDTGWREPIRELLRLLRFEDDIHFKPEILTCLRGYVKEFHESQAAGVK